MRWLCCIALLVAIAGWGCALGPTETIQAPPPDVAQAASCRSQGVLYTSPFGPAQPASVLPNPLPVPVVDIDFAWEQIVAVVEENFKIQSEQRVRLVGDVLTEGRIDTAPLIASTLLEPWRGDSVGFRDRLLNTLQSMRRQAFVRVIPVQSGFLVDLQIDKFLEELPKPIMDQSGFAVFDQFQGIDRTTDPLPSLGDPPGVPPRPPPLVSGWYKIGRDVPLEQVMLAKIQARLAPFAAPAYTTPGGTYGIPPAR